jgi:mono/diheme cytochrome c family protein
MRTASTLVVLAVLSLPLVASQRGRGATLDTAAASSNAPAVLERGNAQRGQYLVTHVAMCIECHSERDAEGTIVQGRQFMGGNIPSRPAWAREWAERAPRNAGLPGYTDEQALRLLTEGAIARDGRQLRPPMPRFRMTPEDAADVIAFMRSLS